MFRNDSGVLPKYCMKLSYDEESMSFDYPPHWAPAQVDSHFNIVFLPVSSRGECSRPIIGYGAPVNVARMAVIFF